MRALRPFRVPALLLALFAASVFLLGSCAPRLGWGVLLWSNQGSGLHAGTVVPVYIRSNIEKLYVVGVPGTNKKIEVPIWQLDLFRSKGAAQKSLAAFGSHTTGYLFATRDGLPIRETPTNAGKRVYRLRQGQSVKILSEAQGEAVSTGGATLEGSWFKVLTEDGTRGYAFSNTMRAYDELTEAPPSLAATADADPARRVDLVFSRVWRAEYFQTMIDEGRVDLDAVSPRFGLFADALRRQIRIELPTVSQVFNYTTIAQSGDVIVFEGSPLRIRFDGDKRLLADWSGAAEGDARQDTIASVQAAPTSLAAPGQGASASALPPKTAVGTAAAAAAVPEQTPAASSAPPLGTSAGAAPASAPPAATATKATFVVLTTDLRDEIRAEEIRRLNRLADFIAAGASWTYQPSASDAPAAPGPATSSRLTLSHDGRFLWTGIEALPTAYLPGDLGVVEEGRVGGEATVRLALDPALGGGWEGAFSLRFDGTRDWLDLLYRHEGRTLLVVPVAPGSVRDLMAGAAASLAPLAFSSSGS